MDYAEALVEITKAIREYRKSVLNNDMASARIRMSIIQQYTEKLEQATTKLEKEHEKRIENKV